MAILKRKKVGIVDFIHPKDGAIDISELRTEDTENDEPGKLVSDIEAYEEDWDFDKHCQLIEGEKPTIFKINFDLLYNRAKDIKNSTIGGQGKEAGFKLGDFSFEVVKNVLVGIEYASEVPLCDRIIYTTKHKKVSDQTMTELLNAGIVEDIFSFYQHHKDDPSLLKKK